MSGEAFVEALLRRANYSVSRVGREAYLPSLIKAGPTTYMPDFLVWREERSSGSTQLFSIVAVEVKVPEAPERFVTDEASKVFDETAEQWPLEAPRLVTAGHLEANAGFDVYPTTAATFSLLLKQIFHSLNEGVASDIGS
jgi:hypothetical protein